MAGIVSMHGDQALASCARRRLFQKSFGQQFVQDAALVLVGFGFEQAPVMLDVALDDDRIFGDGRFGHFFLDIPAITGARFRV
jgi:hypothetical protein